MRFLVRPLGDPDSTLDLTDAVTDAIARQLAAACGGNAVLNRLEAGAHLASLLTRAASSASNQASVPPPVRGSARSAEEIPDAIDDSSEADHVRQPQGFAVLRVALERAG